MKQIFVVSEDITEGVAARYHFAFVEEVKTPSKAFVGALSLS